MPFFIPIMIAATLASMIPSVLPQKAERAQEVINSDGKNYYRRQTWRTGNRTGTQSHFDHSKQDPYSRINLNPQHGINIKKILLYVGLALGAIVLIKVIKK